MNVVFNPPREQWGELLRRPARETADLERRVREIMNEVQREGDKALHRYSSLFDRVGLQQFEVTPEEMQDAVESVSPKLKSAMTMAYDNIHKFHTSQHIVEQAVETTPGVTCWRKSIPIDKVGLYIPGGTAPLFSTVLMLGIPAQIAGCPEVVMCTPAGTDQKIAPAILYAAYLTDIKKIYKIGGAQAIAAMTYGTETIPAVYKIFGPGNQYVTMAKMIAATEGVAIDMPAGPSEVMVVADYTANPRFVAVDLLSQSEHGVDSQSILVTDNENLLNQVVKEVHEQLEVLPRRNFAAESIANSKAIFLSDKRDIVDLMNSYAPEHLILAVENPHEMAEQVRNAGSVFLGNYTPEAAGDYASGTNHTLPTNGYARAYSGVSLDSFFKKVTFQEITRAGLHSIGHTIELMAEAEHLTAHKNAISFRLKD